MTFLILLVGIFIISTCMAFFVFPSLVDELITWLGKQSNLYVVAAIRLVVGLILLLGAAKTGFPGAIWWLGVLFIAAAILIVVFPADRIKRISEAFLKRGDSVVRVWVLLPLLLGVFIVFSVL